ncbi:ABC-type transport auxiliary lipoprotein family protein [Methylobacterium sp. Leaf118]|uniref:ABC-type transport auxiliary lipoprotein family protein n=1 Tax=Methylobacterium sp. Leaf118 TaxID=2876562 RepID=UPI001E61B008|nr:ABC-type transport auxiliary lipoprotein family protein [Methylobacterium sp. Leaf118]
MTRLFSPALSGRGLPKAVAIPCLLALTALGGCGGGATPLTFDLAALPPQGRPVVSARSVVVLEPVGLQPMEADRIIVRERGGSLSFLGGGQWADRLPRLVQTRIIQSLENTGRLRSVSRPGDKVPADFQLVSEIRAFDIDSASGEAVVDLSAKLIADGTGRVANARIFTARVPIQKVDAQNAAVGLDTALGQVLADLVRWVNSGR